MWDIAGGEEEVDILRSGGLRLNVDVKRMGNLVVVSLYKSISLEWLDWIYNLFEPVTDMTESVIWV